ncbi:DUF6366 family protein [Ferdinandcohnia sp. Marseille-Q9671]
MGKDEEKIRETEWKRNPLSNLADSVNRSMVGDPSTIAKSGCLTKVITLVIVIIGLFVLSRCSY